MLCASDQSLYAAMSRLCARACVCIPLAPHARTRMLSMINARNARALKRLYCLLTINSHSCTPHCDCVCVCVAGCGVARCLRDRKLRDIISLVGWTGGDVRVRIIMFTLVITVLCTLGLRRIISDIYNVQCMRFDKVDRQCWAFEHTR